MEKTGKYNILYLSHGGGPLPLLHDPAHAEMVELLQGLAEDLITPQAIVVFSAHWEEEQPTITAHANPDLLYDYYGFPEESYAIQYPAPGNPALAREVLGLLQNHGFSPRLEDNRGFDHGLFIPLKLLYPLANIPCIQISLKTGLAAADHIEIGRALQGLATKDILFVGSGFSFHNMREFFRPPTRESIAANQAFDVWLQETCMTKSLTEEEREQRLRQWSQAPSARFCHPREEHLLPLHICYGLAARAAADSRQLEILGKKASFFLW